MLCPFQRKSLLLLGKLVRPQVNVDFLKIYVLRPSQLIFFVQDLTPTFRREGRERPLEHLEILIPMGPFL